MALSSLVLPSGKSFRENTSLTEFEFKECVFDKLSHQQLVDFNSSPYFSYSVSLNCIPEKTWMSTSASQFMVDQSMLFESGQGTVVFIETIIGPDQSIQNGGFFDSVVSKIELFPAALKIGSENKISSAISFQSGSKL